ncbi:MAG: methenyltetrahydromethanopterin cyclohydrolase [Candidatus Bathyarchaeia archaeon]
MNRNALSLVELMIEQAGKLRIRVSKSMNGATLLDLGLEVEGGFLAGKYTTEVCIGGLGSASLITTSYGDLHLPAIFVATDHPAVALLGSQCAGWRVRVGDYEAMGSGPARALALKPKRFYSLIGYGDDSEVAVIVLEASEMPGSGVVDYICGECGVDPEGLYVLVAPTTSVAGSVQVSGRVAEVGLHRLVELGFDPKRVLCGCGCAPVAPVHPSPEMAMGRANDMIAYGGVAHFSVDYEDDEGLERVVRGAPSSVSRDYGRPFFEVFEEAGRDFYKVDSAIFAPAVLTVNNVRTGSFFKAGRLDAHLLKQSLSS